MKTTPHLISSPPKVPVGEGEVWERGRSKSM